MYCACHVAPHLRQVMLIQSSPRSSWMLRLVPQQGIATTVTDADGLLS
jgi:hypothetical protein